MLKWKFLSKAGVATAIAALFTVLAAPHKW
jgi:hypothetical protein